MVFIENRTFDEIKLGDTASVQRTLQARDVRAWAAAFGDVGPLAEAGRHAGDGRDRHGDPDRAGRVGPAWPRVVDPLGCGAGAGCAAASMPS